MIPRRCPSCLGKFSEQTQRCTNCGMHAERAEWLRMKRIQDCDFGPMTQAELDAINRHAKVHIDPGLLDEINDMIGKAAGLTPEMMARTSTTSRTADEAMARLNERVHAERKKEEAERLQREQVEAARRKAEEFRKAKEREAEELRKAAESFMGAGERARTRQSENQRDPFDEFMWGHFNGGRQNGRAWREEQARQQQAAQPQRAGGVDLDMQMIRRLLQLCHPDKHSNSEASQKATHWLLDVKARLER